jgi:ABC-type dipeptide/oligopeptide/nickel transport system ATPase component
MLQRASIAMSLACDPTLLVADEPTTALDVTIQSQTLEIMHALQQNMGMSIILITHDLGVIAHMAHDVAVMYAGQMIEAGTVTISFTVRRTPTPWVCATPCRPTSRAPTVSSCPSTAARRIFSNPRQVAVIMPVVPMPCACVKKITLRNSPSAGNTSHAAGSSIRLRPK